MPSEGVTYEEVRTAALAVTAQGRNPSVTAVRGHLRTGSRTTISRHLNRWHLEQATKTVPASPEFEDQLAALLAQERARISSDAQAKCEQAVASVQADNIEVTTALEKTEHELEEANQKVTEMAREIERLRATNDERAKEIGRLNEELRNERRVAEAARTDTALTVQRLEEIGELSANQEKELMLLRNKLQATEIALAEARGKAEGRAQAKAKKVPPSTSPPRFPSNPKTT